MSGTSPFNMDSDWSKQDLEELLEMVVGIMPSPEAQMVVAICLMTAGLAAAASDIKATKIVVHSQPNSTWNDNEIHFSVDGIEFVAEVKQK